MFEHKKEPVIPHHRFLQRMATSLAFTLLIVVTSLFGGGFGYHYFGNLPWIDAVLNAAMILTGMGPVDAMTTDAGKLFAIAYSLYSGIAFLTMIAVVLAPVLHRLLHKFHLQDEDDAD